MILDKQFDRDLIIYAFRYTLGRHSYAPGLMMRKLEELWSQLTFGDKELILREIQEHEQYINRIYVGKEKDFNGTYDLNEWVHWRIKMLEFTQQESKHED